MVQIGQADLKGSVTMHTKLYNCPVCADFFIMLGFRYCPRCGVGLDWGTATVEAKNHANPN